MKSKRVFIAGLGCVALIGAVVVFGQAPAQTPAAPAAAPQQGPGVQAPADARYPEWVMSKCKMPPAPRGGGRGGAAARGANPAPDGPPPHRDYAVTAIPGVVAAGQRWRSVWTGTGNNADGIIATDDGGILAAQNTNSAVLKIDVNGRVSTPYTDTKTGGALSMNKKGELFLVSRGLPAQVLQLAPQRRVLAEMYNGEPIDCIGGTINDLTAHSNGGVYFTMGGLFYANAKGGVTRYGENLQTNGVVLSPDEKTLYVTTKGVVAFDVQPDGSLTNQRQFSTVGADGLAVDSAGRLYATTNGVDGVAVIAPDGKVLGMIPTPLNFITVAFSGKDKKTLYGVANNQRFDEIFTLEMIAQG
jgi:gluconolactonase